MPPDSPVLECRGIRKSYSPAGGFMLGGAGDGLSFTAAPGEFLALLGPSGCGKSTTLGLLGGFIFPDAGMILLDGADVTRQPPYRRAVNTVFQSYALFPHMSVGSNVGFGLTMKRVRRAERRARVVEMLDLVGLEGFGGRRVSELSGGQQQRAALARALINRPRLLLLDEPLGALDLRLRRQMQDELVRLKERRSTTFVHVTHDHEEACAIADRIILMENGEIVQVDDPYTLFRRPRTVFAAMFLDSGTVIRGPTSVRDGVAEVAGPGITLRAPLADGKACGGRIAAVLPADKVGVRADHGAAAPEPHAVGTVKRLAWTGVAFLAHIAVSEQLEIRATLDSEQLSFADGAIAIGATVTLTWSPGDVILVDDADPAPARSGG